MTHMAHRLVTQSMCQVGEGRYRCCFLKIYFAIDLLVLNFVRALRTRWKKKTYGKGR